MELRYPLILDGATGTELQKRGYKGNVCAEKWTLEHPEAIVEIQKNYILAGSEVVYTPTFGANAFQLANHGLKNQCYEMNCQLAELSKRAVRETAQELEKLGRPPCLIAGDLSPTGQFLYPMGTTHFDELIEAYRPQAKALANAGVDLFVVETMMTLSDARAAIFAIREVSDKTIMVSFSVAEDGRCVSGADILAALNIFQGMGAGAFGMNCSCGPKEMLTQIRRLGRYSYTALLAKSNAGMPAIVDGKTVYNCPPGEYTSYLPEMAENGVMIFGGCCGTDETHIEAIAKTAKALTMHPPKAVKQAFLPAASNLNAYFLEPGTRCEAFYPADRELSDILDEFDEDFDKENPRLFGIELSSDVTTGDEQLKVFEEICNIVRDPLCIKCDDPVLLEKALRLYQGRSLYEGNIPKETLEKLSRVYGLIY
ncbi:MAG: homocysteine S-methyltransferase family protein [Firmicutes bacterium]|nr:homocysteine S-methyltransferase family protein [Bacillota bacterium]